VDNPPDRPKGTWPAVSCQSPVTCARVAPSPILVIGWVGSNDVREVVDHWELAWRGVLEK